MHRIGQCSCRMAVLVEVKRFNIYMYTTSLKITGLMRQQEGFICDYVVFYLYKHDQCEFFMVEEGRTVRLEAG